MLINWYQILVFWKIDPDEWLSEHSVTFIAIFIAQKTVDEIAKFKIDLHFSSKYSLVEMQHRLVISTLTWLSLSLTCLLQ